MVNLVPRRTSWDHAVVSGSAKYENALQYQVTFSNSHSSQTMYCMEWTDIFSCFVFCRIKPNTFCGVDVWFFCQVSWMVPGYCRNCRVTCYKLSRSVAKMLTFYVRIWTCCGYIYFIICLTLWWYLVAVFRDHVRIHLTPKNWKVPEYGKNKFLNFF
jgi:hypothetical protein